METENKIISHLYISKEDGQYVIQTNEEHQKGVATIASKFAKEFGLSYWGYTLGMLHDKGNTYVWQTISQYLGKSTTRITSTHS